MLLRLMKHLIRKKLNAWHRGLKYIIPPSIATMKDEVQT